MANLQLSTPFPASASKIWKEISHWDGTDALQPWHSKLKGFPTGKLIPSQEVTVRGRLFLVFPVKMHITVLSLSATNFRLSVKTVQNKVTITSASLVEKVSPNQSIIYDDVEIFAQDLKLEELATRSYTRQRPKIYKRLERLIVG